MPKAKISTPTVLPLAEFVSSVVAPAREKQVVNDASGRHSYVSFLWYRGIQENGTTEVFRFQKGCKVEAFHDYAVSKGFSQVAGAFKTRKTASSAFAPSSNWDLVVKAYCDGWVVSFKEANPFHSDIKVTDRLLVHIDAGLRAAILTQDSAPADKVAIRETFYKAWAASFAKISDEVKLINEVEDWVHIDAGLQAALAVAGAQALPVHTTV